MLKLIIKTMYHSTAVSFNIYCNETHGSVRLHYHKIRAKLAGFKHKIFFSSLKHHSLMQFLKLCMRNVAQLMWVRFRIS
jgi:hypothetical protein